MQSTQIGIMQHDLYSWQLEGKNFICLDEVTDGSEFINKTIKGWLVNVEPKKREQIIDVLYEILNTTDAQTIESLKANWFVNAKIILKTYKNIDEETKEVISQTLYALFTIAKDNIFERIPKLPERSKKQ